MRSRRLPFTQALGLPDAFARRIARNTQLILEEESNLAKVSDPAAGSGGIEALTDELCRTAWTLFQEIEAAGGADEALVARRDPEQGRGDARRARESDRHAQGSADRHERISASVGKPVAVLDVARIVPQPYGTPALDISRADADATRPNRSKPCATRPTARLKKTGARPKIFLANLGAPADFIARSMFARNFFEAGGIEAVNSEAGADLAAAFKQSGAKLACLCSSDEVYAKDAVAAAKALSAAGAAHIYLAGRPGEHGGRVVRSRRKDLHLCGLRRFKDFVHCT